MKNRHTVWAHCPTLRHKLACKELRGIHTPQRQIQRQIPRGYIPKYKSQAIGSSSLCWSSYQA